MTNDNEIPARPSASPDEVSVELKQVSHYSGIFMKFRFTILSLNYIFKHK